MSSTPLTGGRLLVEPLEARIAPTNLVGLANNTAFANDPSGNYVTYTTAPSSNHLGFVPASTYLGASAPANVYAIKLTGDGSIDGTTGLSTGDKLLIFNNQTGFNPSTPFLQATNKTIIAFFQDLNGDNQVQINELVGISMAKKSSASVNGSVHGDIVTNLSKDGSTISATSIGNAKTSIASLSINGNVGNIFAGGDINNVSIVGNAGNILAGTAANIAPTVHLAGTANPATGTIAEGGFTAGTVGAAITGLNVTTFTNGAIVHAGDGGQGAVGGSVTSLTVLADTAGFVVRAGDGGVGTDTVKGGVGGDITATTIQGVAGSLSGAVITLQAGNGGADTALKGGAGGSISGVATNFNDFDATTNTGTVSADLLLQSIIVHAGDGGAGFKGGRGGDVVSSSIFSAGTANGAVTAGFTNASIQVLAGHGGLPTTAGAGKGGAGGNVSQVFAEDLNPDVIDPGSVTAANPNGVIDATDVVLVQAGDGGFNAGVGSKNGGGVSGVGILGAQIIANAGNGADGINKGGFGGDVDTLNILSLTTLFTHQLTINAGTGGASSNGSGGAGGNVNMVTVLDSDLNLLAINSGTHANGGVGNAGIGGAGGLVTNVQINDNDFSGALATVTVRSGAGGNGAFGGGNGGDIGNATSPVQMFGLNYNYTATAGAGGSILAGGGGNGGNGGNLDTVGFSSVPNVTPIEVGNAIAGVAGLTNYTSLTGSATAGAGGAGTDSGGLGGGLAGVNLRAGFNVVLTAGAGGAGGTGAGGAGGAVVGSAGVSLGGAVSVFAGNAAGVGGFAADGGRIQGVIASAQTDINLIAGSGGLGGVGGDIIGSGTTANPLYTDPAFNLTTGIATEVPVSNFGNVTITAGAGSSANGVAGQGGSVTNFNGFIGLGGNGGTTGAAGDSTDLTAHITKITAGAGGGGTGQTASGAGGSVTNLQLTGNNLNGNNSNGTLFADDFGGQVLTIDAGNAGQSAAAKKGGAGGDVNIATIYNLDVSTVVQHIAAGDGSAAVKKGGAGGSITEVHVGRPGDAVADIGVRSGVAYGYAAGTPGTTLAAATGGAGGLFAGVGGAGAKTTGANGSVTNITAKAIASIVAGKTGTIHLANTVDNISLEGNAQSDLPGAVNADGSYNNFDSLIIVGSVQNPDLAGDPSNNGAGGATTYHAGDGLIAATNLTMNRDFTPEALLTVDASGNLVFVDYQQPKPTPVTTSTIPFAASL